MWNLNWGVGPMFFGSRKYPAGAVDVWIGALLVLGMVSSAGSRWSLAEEPHHAQATSTARLVIDYGDGVEKHFSRLPCKAGTTVWDLMQLAAKHRRGIRIQHQGQRDTLLVTSIDGTLNEGGGRNWIYRVNDKLGNQSAGIRAVAAGDTVLWRFQTYK